MKGECHIQGPPNRQPSRPRAAATASPVLVIRRSLCHHLAVTPIPATDSSSGRCGAPQKPAPRPVSVTFGPSDRETALQSSRNGKMIATTSTFKVGGAAAHAASDRPALGGSMAFMRVIERCRRCEGTGSLSLERFLELHLGHASTGLDAARTRLVHSAYCLVCTCCAIVVAGPRDRRGPARLQRPPNHPTLPRHCRAIQGNPR